MQIRNTVHSFGKTKKSSNQGGFFIYKTILQRQIVNVGQSFITDDFREQMHVIFNKKFPEIYALLVFYWFLNVGLYVEAKNNPWNRLIPRVFDNPHSGLIISLKTGVHDVRL